MKKKILVLVFMIAFLGKQGLYAQDFGSWVVPPYRINFYDDGPQVFNGLVNPNHFTFSDAAMKNNGEIYFYLVDRILYDKNNQEIGELTGPSGSGEQLEVEIINVPGQNTLFYIIWGVYAVFDYGVIRYAKVDCSGNTPVIVEEQEISSVYELASYAITDIQNNVRYMYLVRSNGGTAGVYKYLIDANGISFIGTIVTDSDPILNDHYYFSSINAEIDEAENELAWCSYGDFQKIFMVHLDANGNFNSSSIIDVNQGFINGIEFSNQTGSNTIYASCEGTNGGIKKINYNTGQITSLTSNGQYGLTFLQTASDEYIYAVSNAGDKLGRINTVTNTFTPEVISDLTIKSSDAYEGKIIYKLPEDLTVYSTLNIYLTSTEESCPDAQDGTASAYPGGGTPPYSYLWTPGGETTQTISNLSVGTYTCCVTDAIGDEVCKSVEVTYPEQLFFYDNIQNLSGTQTIEGWNRSFRDGIRIMPGAVITIKNSTLEFGKYAKIIVDKYAQAEGDILSGGELILDNCVLTNVSSCNSLWQGIEVWGDDNYSQYYCDEFRAQGKVTIKNGTKIKNAEIGILLGEKDESGNFVQNSGGGILQIYNDGNPDTRSAFFINNKYSIRFFDYSNFKPDPDNCLDVISYMDNISIIKDTKFEINQDYFENIWQKACIYMSEVKGIKIAGCEFVNNFNEHHGHGINSYNAGFKVYSLCYSQVSPCPEGDMEKCTFDNFKKGINLGNYNSTHTIDVENAEFTNNSIGVSISNVPNASILFSNFYIGEYPADEGDCEGEGETVSAYGIDMNGCTGFAIEENHFYKYEGAPKGNYTGIRCKDSHTEYDLIYNNTFTGLSYGNFAEGMNRDIIDDAHGLEYQCNINSGNNVDFQVEDLSNPLNAMIRGYMGYTNISAGNTFSQQSGVQWHFLNLGKQQIDYYWYEGNSTEEPEYYCIFDPIPYPDPCYFKPNSITTENTCPTHYGGGGSGGNDSKSVLLTPQQFQETEQTFYDALNNYSNIEALFNNLQDGGNTQSLKSEVETAFPSDMWQLRTELLGISPHLSKDVLMTTAEKTDVFPESALFEILSANPDELRNGEMISFLENKEEPLPDYMIDMLKQIAGGVTYKTILKRQMADFRAQKSQAANDIIRSILADSIVDMQLYRNWLDNIGSIETDKQIIASYIQEGDFTSAQTLLDLIPSIYELTGDRLVQYNDYKSLTEFQMNLKQQNRSIFELDSLEINFLIDFAENSNGTAKAAARGILSFGYGYNYCNCLPADSSAMKSSFIDFDKPANESGIGINAKPNPADSWVAFDYHLPSYNSEAVLKITDIEGREIARFRIDSENGQKIWDIREIDSGVYFYTLDAGTIKLSNKLIIK